MELVQVWQFVGHDEQTEEILKNPVGQEETHVLFCKNVPLHEVQLLIVPLQVLQTV